MYKRIISLLLAAWITISALPKLPLVVSAAANDIKPQGYHLATELPTAENPKITGLYLGAAVENGGTFYGLSSKASSNTFSTSTNSASRCGITVHYGGNDATYGNYYYLEFAIPGDASYALAYAGGYFTQNKLTNGLPSGGWAYKHRLYFDQDGQFFYHRVQTSLTTVKGLKLSTSSQKIFTETVANLKVESTSYVPVRLYMPCVSNGVAGSNATHTWSGTCTCGNKFDYQEKTAPEHYHVFTALPTATAPATTATLYLGAPVETEGVSTFYGISSKASSNAFSTSSKFTSQCTITVHYGGNDATYGNYYYLEFAIPGDASYALAYAGGYFTQNKLTNGLPSGGWAYKHRLYFDQDGQFFYHRAEADKSVMKGLKLSTSSHKLFVETVANLKTQSTAYVPVRLYAPCVSDGVAGGNATHNWTGSCTCGYRFGLTEKTPVPTAEGYHLFAQLPTAEKPVTAENLYLGAALQSGETKVFYALNSMATDNAFTTTSDADGQCKITVRYGGNDATYGDYYYVEFTLSSGVTYTLAYAGGYFTQNKIQNDGLPSGGWAYKHRLYFDEADQFFYHRVQTSLTTVKGLKLSTGSQKIFTETVANLKTESTDYVPVRLFARCTAVEPAGNNQTHHWDGVCSCGYQLGYSEHQKAAELNWNIKTVDGHSKVCSCGFVLVALTGHNVPSQDQWQADPEYGIKSATCQDCGFTLYEDHTHVGKWEKDDTSHWKVCGVCSIVMEESNSHSYGQWTTVTIPTTLTEKGSEQRTCTACGHVQTQETSLKAEDFAVSENPPSFNVPFYLGATQLQIEGKPTYFFKGAWAPSKYVNMDVTTDMYGAMAMYAEKAEGGYKLYFDNNGVKTYLMIDHMTVNEQKGVFVQPTTDAVKASVFKWNTQFATFQTNVAGRGDYYIGLYTDDKGTAYTKLQALLVSGLGRNDRHPSKIYMSTASDHEHTYGEWVVLSVPTTLQEQGMEKRTCSVCGGEEIRVTTLNADDFKPSANPPAANVPFYLGATQLQVAGKPTYFFKGAWAPSKYVNMDVTTDMYGAQAMYAEEAGEGYKLYFDNNGVKTYLMIDHMTVNEQKGVFVQPTTDAVKASVFKWNTQFATFQTNVAGRGDYYIGLYTDDKGTAYTKLQALLVSGLGRDDRHPSKIYMNTVSDHEHTYGEWVVLSVPTTLQEQGKEKRTCSVCGGEEIRVTTLNADDFKPSANPPAANVPFYLGATQLQVAGKPTYFFKGAWAPSKYVNMDVTTDMYGAQAMYAEETESGYKLYFDNNGVKTYLMIDHMTVNEQKGVFVQPTTDAKKASVFKWNTQFATFQTNVAGRGDYYIGLYTDDKGTAYTKLQALLVSGLGRDDRHPSKVYMNTVFDHKHNFSDWSVLSVPTTLQEQGKEKRKCSICGYEEIRVTTLRADDFVASSRPPATNVPFYLGTTQRQIKDKPTYFFKGAWAPSKYLNMDVSTKMETATAMYAEAVAGGYKLYFYDAGVKTYLILDEMTVSKTKGVFVQPTTDAKKASVFMWNEEFETFYTYVASRDDNYYIGLYTHNNVKYTKLQALLVSGLGRNDRHPSKVYLRTYEEEGHKHTFGKWVTKSNPTHLNDQGVQERACTGCDYVQARVVMLDASAYAPATKAPRAGTGFYLGAVQLQMEERPAYFFMGEWLPRKFQRMDVSDDMKKGALMYSQAAEGGYKLYFYNMGVKTYLTIAETRVEGDKGVFVQPVTESKAASVFTWNEEYGTFQTEVEGKGNFCIGNYTIAEIKYTKLSAISVDALNSADYHAAVPYVSRYIHYDVPKTGDTTPVLLLVTVMVLSATALVVLVIGKKKLSLTEEK